MTRICDVGLAWAASAVVGATMISLAFGIHAVEARLLRSRPECQARG